jgi:AAA15 family ATPase/GTPase
MIRSIHIKNFKAWADSRKIRLAPLTILCGNNSSGKSSLAQFMLMLKQTVESYDRQRVLHLGDDKALVDLGTYKDLIFNHETDHRLHFTFDFDAIPHVKVVDAVKQENKGSFGNLGFEAQISFDQKNSKIQLDRLKYTLTNGDSLSFLLQMDQGGYRLDSENYQAVRQKGRAWRLPAPENFFGFPDEAIAYYQNTGFLNDLSLAIKNLFKSTYYVGPLREHPERFYQFSGEEPPDVGSKGKLAINALLAAKERKIARGYKARAEGFEALIARWLKEMGLIHSFAVKPISEGRKEYEVRIRVQPGAPEVLITDVGFGISQVLPVIVQCFYVQPDSTLFFEQPEIHLHPSVQSHLGDLFIEATKSREKGKDRNTQIIVESHSEHLIRRIQRRIAEDVIKPQDVALYFIRQHRGRAVIEEMSFDIFGNITNWPDDFFGNDLEDLAAMTKAARNKKKQQQNG